MKSSSTSADQARVVAATIRDVASEPAAANIIPLPFSRARYLIVQTRRDCEALRRNINVVVECLRALACQIEDIDDRSVREGFQSQLTRLNELLLLRLDQLSVTERWLQEMLHHT